MDKIWHFSEILCKKDAEKAHFLNTVSVLNHILTRKWYLDTNITTYTYSVHLLKLLQTLKVSNLIEIIPFFHKKC